VAENVLARLAVDIRANTAQFNAALKQSQAQFNSFTGGITKAAGTLGIGLGAAAAFGVINDAVSSMKAFQQQLATVQAITGATSKEFDQLKASALALGGSTQFTAKQVAELQTEFGRLGFTVPEILNATEATIDLATATGEDLAKSADTAGSTIRGFGLDASETRRVVDVMAESFNKSALGLSNFTEAMKYVAPIAKSANLSVEETTALLGTLADAGIRGSQAGTSLRKIITDLAKDGRPLAVRLKELADRGLSFAQANDEVGRTAYASLLVLTQNQKKTEDLAKALNNASGAAKETADIVGNTLAGDLRKLAGAYDGVIQSAGGATDVLREFVQAGTNILNALNGQNGVLGEYTEKWLKLAFIVPRTVAKIINGISNIANKSLEEAVEDFNEDFGSIPEGEDAALFLGKRAKALEELKKQAKEANRDITDFGDAFGKMVVIIRDAPSVINGTGKAIDEEIKATFETIQSLEEKVKGLRKTQEEETPTGDILGLQRLQNQIDATLLKIENIRNAIAGVRPELEGALKTLEAKPLSDSPRNPSTVDTDNYSIDPFVIPPVDTDAYIESLKKVEVETEGTISRIQGEFISFGSVVNSALSGLGQALGSAISGSQDLGSALLGVLGSVLVQLGEMILAAGIGVEAFKASLESLQGPVAIAAGIALIALGSALSSSISGLGSNPTSSSSAASGGGRSNKIGGLGTNGFEIKVGGEFRIKGRDLVYIVDRNEQLNSRTTG
jgi:hypothetical protein